MPHRNWKIRIYDILKSLEAIRTYTRGVSFEDFTNDQKTVDDRQIMIGLDKHRKPAATQADI